MSRLQFFKQDDGVWDQPAGLPVSFGARAYDPAAPNSGDAVAGHSGLSDACTGDWSWKPYRYDGAGRYLFPAAAGKRCSCTLTDPVGTHCARHTN